MIEWSEEQQVFRDAVRRFIEAEIVPNLEELEHGDTPPYEVLRKLYATFGIAEMQMARFQGSLDRDGSESRSESEARGSSAAAEGAALQMILVMELCRYCPGMVTALGVSAGLTVGAIAARGTRAQKERWIPPLLTLEKIGAWAITEPGSGSDAFGAMMASARREDDGSYVLNGTKTFITNGPWADSIVFICKLDDGSEPKDRKILSFVIDRGMPGLTQSKPLRKMGMHSSPTGELFLQDVRVDADRLLGESEDAYGRSGAKETFGSERSGVASMALGIVDRCLELSVRYSKERAEGATALVGRVTADPDFHYRGVFASYLPTLEDPTAKRLIAEALRRASESVYVVEEVRLRL